MRAGRWVHPFLEVDGPLALAHRGGDGVGTENTLPAFQDAVELGYRVLETDLQVSADGRLMLFHDATLDRVTDARGPIAAHTAAQLARVRVGGEHPVPTFDEAVASFPDVRWNLDVKSDAAARRLVERLAGDVALAARVCVGSFSDARLRRVRATLGRIVCTSAGPGEVRAIRLASFAGPVAGVAVSTGGGVSRRGSPLRIDADCLQVPERHGRIPIIDRWFLGAAVRLGLPVHVWTVNVAADMHRLLDLGVDGLVTDATRTLRAVLHERGVWPVDTR